MPSDPKKPWPCRACGRTFASEKVWMRHEARCPVALARPAIDRSPTRRDVPIGPEDTG